jgi:hypothetical protein
MCPKARNKIGIQELHKKYKQYLCTRQEPTQNGLAWQLTLEEEFGSSSRQFERKSNKVLYGAPSVAHGNKKWQLQACVSLGQNARWLGRGLQTS